MLYSSALAKRLVRTLMLSRSVSHKNSIAFGIKYLMTPLVVILFLSAFSASASQSPKFGFFIKNEVNGDDYISGVGSEIWLTNRDSNFGMSVLTSIGKAEVTDREGTQHDYIAWEAGFKFGYFSDIFAYAEVGFDLGELAFQDRDEDHHYRVFHNDDDNDFVVVNRSHHDDSNDIDGYVGVGAGFKFEHLQIEAFTRYRQVDGEHWKADSQAYTGAKLSVVF